MREVIYHKYLPLLIGLLLIFISCIPVRAQDDQSWDKSVIFLLDTSGSMKTSDPERLALDSIAQLIYSLPSNYGVGLATYSTEAALLQGEVENSRRIEIMDLAQDVVYQGYSNAGAGLVCTVEALAETHAREKYIVMLSDGEILMNEDAETQESQQMYQTAMERAREQGIIIHVIGLGENMEDLDNNIFKAAAVTGGKSWHVSQAAGIQGAIDAVLAEMGVKQSTVAIVDAGGGEEKIAVELPYLQADRIRVLLTGSAPIQNLNSAFQAESARQINGERYSLLEIERPSDGHLEIGFEAAAGTQVRINAIPEYSVLPKVEIAYEDRLPEEEESLYYQRTAKLSYTFYSEENPNISLWESSFFEHGKITLNREGEADELSLYAGVLEMQERVSGADEYEVYFDYSKLPINVIGEDHVTVSLEAPPVIPVEEPKPPSTPVGIWVAGAILLAAVIACVVLILCIRRPKPVPAPAEERPQPSKYNYVGKVNLYITRTKSGYDIPPLYYNLFRLPAGKVLSLQEILKECDVLEEFPGAKGIYFKPGMNRSLILTNNSDCTIMKSREILMKNKSYQLALGAKVDISFEDEISELTLQYKDLKPSEAWQ